MIDWKTYSIEKSMDSGQKFGNPANFNSSESLGYPYIIFNGS